MNKNLLKTGIQEFISKNLNTDILSVLLKKSPFPNISSQELARQLEGKQISEQKFPTLFQSTGILFPKKVHLEQASSEATARYKSGLVSGESLLDLTCGMGVDSLFFASSFKRVICCEKNATLARYTQHNLKELRQDHVEVREADGLSILRAHTDTFDCIYVDPSRRKSGKKRVLLEDYEPDILSELDLLLDKCSVLMLKTSPMLDITQGIKQMRQVSECHIVAVGNEVKELVWILQPEIQDETRLIAVNIQGSTQSVFAFTMKEERETSVVYHAPMEYLYEPNAAILKSGGFKAVARQFHLKKLAASSHLYTSKGIVDFPGRRFRITAVQEFNKHWNKKRDIQKANITTRNFGISVADIRKRFQLADGGDTYLFFTTLSDGKKVVIHTLRV